MNITFEKLQEHHLPEVKEIYDWYIKNSTATFHTESLQVNELKEFIYIGHPLYTSFLICADDKPSGYCFFAPYKKRQAYNRTAEVTIYLKPGFEKKGIGKTALEYLEQKGRENGLKNLLGIITGDNEGSMALFRKCGYTQCACFKNVGEKFGKVLDVVAFQKEI
ncbi:GNAT family N-acetyltransferase [Sinomicrobium weinanense]|uniref:N-acetyltransferase family protein n=1 Tax=Sinomicrobium weinanense TaxID=2842200 RepID=A0A926Q5Q9_9FLAO|nr:GNAT family N-acetyltransferase [Sinomicrobium weinanense]MBC9798250.1 N-acetyltransferase family protein [Sinomicrobium weinanense]MBU3122645.1 GNAT family N-acetyltransferase [Sinomicrobium weinanense]